MQNSSHAGRRGQDVRSDCWVSFSPRDSGGKKISVKSRVESMYGDSIRKIADEALSFFGIEHAILEIEDAGALPFTIKARIETAVIRSGTEIPEYLPDIKPHCTYSSTRNRFRRSRLYLPGNDPKYFINAGLHKPDAVILDLEDSVAPPEKDAARTVVRNALRQVNFFGAERMVRINQGEQGLEDLEWIVPHNVHVILIPKIESADQVKAVDERINIILRENAGAINVKDRKKAAGSATANLFPSENGTAETRDSIFLMPIIESAKGGIMAFEIASASLNNIALAIGLEDYTADIGTQRTLEGRESFWLRAKVVNAARAAGIQPIDTVFSDVADMEGLRQSVIEAKSLGFEGKGCIHPRQIAIVHEAFAPAQKEIDKAKKIVLAFEEAEKAGLGVVSLGSKMIDPPVVKRALSTVNMAESLGMLTSNWRKEDGK